jgi:hypothetical protein
VTQKKIKAEEPILQKSKSMKSKAISVIADEYEFNYDTFMTNLAHLKVVKAFTEIDVVKRSKTNVL